MLREVIERVQSGEEVDVEKVLGTGDEKAEQEWAEILKEVREEEVLFQSKKRRRAAREEARDQEANNVAQEEPAEVKEDGMAKVESIGGVKFY